MLEAQNTLVSILNPTVLTCCAALEEPSGLDSATRGDLFRDLFRDSIYYRIWYSRS